MVMNKVISTVVIGATRVRSVWPRRRRDPFLFRESPPREQSQDLEMESTAKLYGVVGEFSSPDTLLHAARRVRAAGYTMIDAFSPIPVPALTEALGIPKSRLAILVLIGGVIGAAVGLGLQYWASAIHYPHIVSGRPFFSWPSFIPITFKCTVLFAAIAAVLGMLARNRLPELYHPIFAAPGFERASTDGFFLCIEARDPNFQALLTPAFLKQLGAERVSLIDRHPDDRR